ncbi:protein-glutamate methylesterase/protein-glutamine glutaminase [Ekhidna sp.]
MKKIKVLIIDDSALVRQTISAILESDSRIEVSGVASDPYVAVKKIKENLPDVITLDIEMPKMDGLTFLRKLMSQHPIPVLVISTLTEKGTASAIQALEHGAVEVISKPKINTKEYLESARKELCRMVVEVSHANVSRKVDRLIPTSKLTADAVITKRSSRSMIRTTDKVIAVGASTGGTEAIKDFLMALPIDCPGVVIVQHMPEMFTRQFAKRLNDLSNLTIKEAKDNDHVLRGQVLIAPGNYHLLLNRSGANYYVQVQEGPVVNRHRPSVDVLFRSVAKYAGKNAIGIIMTGMGDDGASGLLEMREAGAHTIAQDEKSCVVFGMPAAAIKMGAAERVLPLDRIAHAIRENEEIINT